MPYRVDFTGRVFGRLTVLSRSATPHPTKTIWTCVCACGTQKDIAHGDLQSGRTVSCGCQKREKATKHGHTAGGYSSTYYSWRCMKQRCLNSKDKHYHYYGGRGITLYTPWMRFDNFLRDMGEKPAGMELDRIDPNGHYEPGNCRWVDKLTQRRNTRAVHKVTFAGKTQTLAEWAVELGIKHATLQSRIFKYGWSVERAFSTPTNNP